MIKLKKWINQYYDYLALVVSVIVSALLRIVAPYDMVFQNGKVIYNAADAYFHMRFVDLILANYPQIHSVDPYIGHNYIQTPLWGLLIVWVSNGFGSVDIAAAYLPAILGILTLIPIFVITKIIFKSKLIASLAVIFGAIISGLFYARTQLGAADHHALEIFLLTMMIMWAVICLTNKYKVVKSLSGILVALTVTMYYFTWGIPGIITVLVISSLSAYVYLFLKLRDNHRNWFKGIVWTPILMPLILFLSHNGYLGSVGSLIKHAVPINFETTIAEGFPLLFSCTSADAVFLDLSVVWGYFGLLFFVLLIGIGMLLYQAIKYKRSQDILLLSWTIVILIMTLIARRWAYYLAVNVVIISAFSLIVLVKALVKVKGVIKVKRLAFAFIIILAFVVVPFVRNDIGIAKNEYNYVTQGWQEVSTFLRDELIESEEEKYYKIWTDELFYSKRLSDIPYVLSWWDYGYYLIRESHMPVISHPGGKGQKESARLLISNDNDIVQQLKELDIGYIVIDNRMTSEYFYAIAKLADKNADTYYEIDYANRTIIRTPAYFNTLLARLYFSNNFDGIELVYASNACVLVFDGIWMPEVKIYKVQ